MNELIFIKGKGLITKSIDDFVVWGYFECSVPLYEQLHKQLNKVLTLQVELEWNMIELSCNINTDTKWYLQFIEDHWVVKLDIQIPDILLSGYILKGNIKLILWK